MAENVFMNGEMRRNETQQENPGKHQVNKYIYLTLSILLGAFGVHKFYARHFVSGLFYLLFCWSLVPMLLGFIDFVRASGQMRDVNDRIWV